MNFFEIKFSSGATSVKRPILTIPGTPIRRNSSKRKTFVPPSFPFVPVHEAQSQYQSPHLQSSIASVSNPQQPMATESVGQNYTMVPTSFVAMQPNTSQITDPSVASTGRSDHLGLGQQPREVFAFSNSRFGKPRNVSYVPNMRSSYMSRSYQRNINPN